MIYYQKRKICVFIERIRWWVRQLYPQTEASIGRHISTGDFPNRKHSKWPLDGVGFLPTSVHDSRIKRVSTFYSNVQKSRSKRTISNLLLRISMTNTAPLITNKHAQIKKIPRIWCMDIFFGARCWSSSLRMYVFINFSCVRSAVHAEINPLDVYFPICRFIASAKQECFRK